MQQKILVGGIAVFVGVGLVVSKVPLRDAGQALFGAAITFGLLGALVYGLWRILFPGPGKAMFCSACGHEGPSKQITKGSTGLELFLWLLFLLPGLLYSIWRHSSRANGCAACGSTSLIPPDSPMAVRQKKTLQS